MYQYTLQHYKDEITINDVAKITHLAPQSFCRYFKKHTRKTYIQFLNEIRIGEACKQIISPKFEGVASVAFDCGFNSIINFNRVFKQIIGSSPLGYLKDYEQKTIN